MKRLERLVEVQGVGTVLGSRLQCGPRLVRVARRCGRGASGRLAPFVSRQALGHARGALRTDGNSSLHRSSSRASESFGHVNRS